jgi:hypothetical protein
MRAGWPERNFEIPPYSRRTPFSLACNVNLYASTPSTTMTIKQAERDAKLVLHASGWDEVIIPRPEETFYAVTGNESQVLTVKLAPGDALHGEPGSMMYMSDGMKQSIICDECMARCCTGEDVSASFSRRMERRNGTIVRLLSSRDASHLSLSLHSLPQWPCVLLILRSS